jgi:glutathione S-transferase
MKLHHSSASPNSRRVRMFIAEKGLDIPRVPVDLGNAEQHAEAYRAINPRRVVPTLVLDDGSAIGEVPVISRYLDDVYPEPPLFGATAKDKALAAMWERRIELEGFASVMEGVRNRAPGLKNRAVAGPHDYAQIPELVARSVQRVKNLFADMDARLAETAYVAGDGFTVADITLLVTVDFAAKALDVALSDAHVNLRRWYASVAGRASASA